MEKKRFKNLFPHLAEEMESGRSNAGLEFSGENPRMRRKWEGYEPSAVDFIRRCETLEEAEEIIDFLRNQDKLASDEAEELREKLREKGLRSFGRKKSPGFYEREG